IPVERRGSRQAARHACRAGLCRVNGGNSSRVARLLWRLRYSLQDEERQESLGETANGTGSAAKLALERDRGRGRRRAALNRSLILPKAELSAALSFHLKLKFDSCKILL